jgi:hypothetical protein
VSGTDRLRRPLVASLAMLIGVCAFSGEGHDGQRDFDFNLGSWKTHVRRLLQPLADSSSWTDYDGTSVVSRIWDGRANLIELEADGPTGHLEGLGLRLYNPLSHQWSLNWASSADGAFQPPMIGQFSGGRGEFVDQEVIDGKSILSRNAFLDVSKDFARFDQAFSPDGGVTWESNWVMTFARTSSPVCAIPSDVSTGGQRDFDFAFGTWKTHIERLKEPLSASAEWITFDGTHIVKPVWGGRANIGELEADGASGHIEAMSPRLYNPRTHLWNISYGNPRDGVLSRPVVGQFKHGRGEFYGQDTYKGSAVLVREIYSPVDSNTRRLDIAYSTDGGRSWETNWKMTDTLIATPSLDRHPIRRPTTG